MTRHSTAAAAIALLALVLAGCDGGGSEESAPSQDARASAPAETEEAEPETEPEEEEASIDDLAALMLAPEDFPSAGWELLSNGPDDDSDDTGGVCAFDFDEAVAADAPEAEASFSNNTLMTFATQGLVQVPEAETVLADILTELEACVGQTEATDGDTTALITSEPLDFSVPGAAVGGCRYAESIVDGTPLSGPFCFGASGDRMMMFAALSPDPNGGVTPEELTAVLTAATAKAFTG